jgi:hypothetical protein
VGFTQTDSEGQTPASSRTVTVTSGPESTSNLARAQAVPSFRCGSSPAPVEHPTVTRTVNVSAAAAWPPTRAMKQANTWARPRLPLTAEPSPELRQGR